jgi:hypothetical protein
MTSDTARTDGLIIGAGPVGPTGARATANSSASATGADNPVLYHDVNDGSKRCRLHRPQRHEPGVLPAAGRQPSFENRVSAVAQLVKIIVTPALDVDRFERQTLLPTPVSRLSIDDERWLREHRPGPDVPRIDARRDVRIRASLDVNQNSSGFGLIDGERKRREIATGEAGDRRCDDIGLVDRDEEFGVLDR